MAEAVILMGKGLGRVELAILDELRQGDADINTLAIAASGLKAHVISFWSDAPEYQSAARAVRSLVSKGLISRGGDGGKQQQTYHLNN